MSDIGELWKDVREARMGEAMDRRLAAGSCYLRLADMARHYTLGLERHSDAHYSITHLATGWRLNVYPGNRRVYMDRNRARAPYLVLPRDWTLENVVMAAIGQEQGVKG